MAYTSWASSPNSRKTMVGNRRSDTKPELAIRSALHRRGLRFRKDLRLDLGDVKPRPDVVFPRVKVAVFIDGCFWHSCPDHRTEPRTNVSYWSGKLARNVERDREHDAALTAAGWVVLRIWEHTPPEVAVRLVEDLLKPPSSLR